MFRLLIVGVMFLGACSTGRDSVEVLDDAPIHTEVAELMPPGRLAMLQVGAIGEYQWDMEARANAAAALWSYWADAIDECSVDQGLDQVVPRFEAPASDDLIWDLMREPDHAFRPYGKEWNENHGFSSSAPSEFWDSPEIAYLNLSSPELLDTECARRTYPYEMLLALPGENHSHGGFLDSLGLTLLEQIEPVAFGEFDRTHVDQLFEEVDLAKCLLDGGVPQWVLESDHYELFAGSQGERPLVEAARYSVVEAGCYDEVFTPVDDELLEMALEFASQSSEQLTEALRVQDRVDEWIDRLSAR